MSYCRFSKGDIYLYFHVLGYITCCGCRIKESWKDPQFFNYQAAIDRVKKHISTEHSVPTKVLETLRREGAEFNSLIRDFRPGLQHGAPSKEGDH